MWPLPRSRTVIDAGSVNSQIRQQSLNRGSPLFYNDLVIIGHLDIYGLHLECDVHFQNCIFSHSIVAIGFRGHSLFLDSSCLISGIDARDIDLSGSLFMRNGFASFGPVLLRDAIVSRVVDCTGAAFLFDGSQPELQMSDALAKQHDGQSFGASRSKIGTLFWEDIEVAGAISFRNAKVEVLRDDLARNGSTSWQAASVDLLGFEFKDKNPSDFEGHKRWLEVDADSTRGRSSQVAQWLTQNGEPDQAHRILLWSRRKGLDGLSGHQARARNLYLLFISLSFNPPLIILLLSLLFFLFSVTSYFLWGYGYIIPSSESVFSDPCYFWKNTCDKQNWQAPAFANHNYRTPFSYPEFSSLSYALGKGFPFFGSSASSHWYNSSPVFSLFEIFYTSISLGLQGMFLWALAGRRSINPN